MSNVPHPRPKPTLDDLLRLKRAERPDAAFWHDFERGLREKQLAAIVEPRPWWITPSLWVRKAAPYGGLVALGAAAVLTVMLVRSPGLDGAARASTKTLAMARSASPAVVESIATEVATPPSESSGVRLAEVESVQDTRRQDTALATTYTVPPGERGLVSALGDAVRGQEIGAAESSQSERTGAAAAVALASLDLGWASVGVTDRVSATADDFATAAGTQAVAEALGDTAALEDLVVEAPTALLTRHDRLLIKATEDLAGAEEPSLGQVREHVVHRLADGEALYASITRVGVSGDRLSLKF